LPRRARSSTEIAVPVAIFVSRPITLSVRERVRIQPYVSRDIQGKLRAYSAARRLTESAVTEAALGEYLERDQVERALVVRRLDGVAEAVGRLQHDMDVVGQVLAVYLRYVFLASPAAPTVEVRRRADAVYDDFLVGVARQLGAGVRLTGEVFRARSAAASGGNRPVPGGR
jgi:hypothetical protein